MPDLAALLETLDADPWRRGKAFEKYAKNWLEADPVWSSKFSDVWLWDEWPGRSGPDIGIDIVAKGPDGLWAIQVKCFDESASIPKTEIDSFLSAASHRIFQHRLLVATTNKLSSNASQTLQAQGVVKVLREDLDNSPVIWTSLTGGRKSVALPPAKPRPHQIEAIKAVVDKFKVTPRGQLQMACGTGKTLTSLWIKEALDVRLTLVLLPSLSLLSQTLRSWATNRSEQWDYLAVCSDATVDQVQDEFVGKTSDLPFSVTTNPESIRDFLTQSGRLVVFSTYQSSEKLAEACGSDIEFDLVICDEAHKLAGKLNSSLKVVLNEERLLRKRTLYQTATPRVFSGAIKANLESNDVQVASMDDFALFGEPFHKLSFGEAISRDLLTDYKVIVTLVTDDEIGLAIRNRLLIEGPDGVTDDANVIASAIGVVKILREHSLERAISFHSSVRRATRFANLLSKLSASEHGSPELPAVSSKVIHGDMKVYERRLLLNELQSGTQVHPYVLTNARCLTEGVDVPSLDAVAFVDPKQSTGDIVQAVGRAIRKSDRKETGWILLPLHVRGEDQNIEFDETDFMKIWHVVNALRSHDDLLAEELDSIRREIGEAGHSSSRISKVEFDFPSELAKFEGDFTSSITSQIVRFTTPVWEEWFGLLLRYVRETGSADVPYAVEYEGRNLGRWVVAQRTHLQSDSDNSLASNRRARLEELPGWVWNTNEASWTRRFEALKSYAEAHGNARPPIDLIYQGEKLGDFVRVLRWGYKSYGLEPERIKLLEALPGWAWNKYDGDWLDFFDATRNFKALHGRPPMIGAKDRSERSLGMWIGTQRRYRDRLSIEKVSRLESLPFWTWDPNQENWDKHLQTALQLLKETGKISPPRGKVSLYPGLVNWIQNQKKALAANDMSESRMLALKPILGHLEIKSATTRSEEAFEMNFGILKRYSHLHALAELNTEKTTFENFSLGHWVQKQREKKQQGKLTSQQIRQLESLPGWDWAPKANSWNAKYQALLAFQKDHGHLMLDPKEHAQLLEWLKDQRKHYLAGKGDLERARSLELIPGWAWESCNLSIDVAIEALQQFTTSEGHSKIGPDVFVRAFPLGKWARVIRTLYSKNLVLDATIQRIEAIEGWTWGLRKPK